MLSSLTTYQLELFLKANRVKPQHIIYQALKKYYLKYLVIIKLIEFGINKGNTSSLTVILE